MAIKTVIPIDIGAESGRVMAAHFDGSYLHLEEVERFPNTVAVVRGTRYWDVLRLWSDIQTGLAKIPRADSIGLDTWGVDFALVDKHGQLISNPVQYRDSRTDGMMDYTFQFVPRAQIFERTGIQFMQINSIFQLMSMVKSGHASLAYADRFLTIPDLLYYWLTGVQLNEYTNATTTQLYDTRANTWAYDLMEQLGIPTRLFKEITQPGVVKGSYHGVPVSVAAHHDTGSAVVGVPTATPNFAYISSGTWSLLGMETPAPVINEAALAANLTNEGGFGGTNRVLKNIMGLWLLQESRRTWHAQGLDYSYEQLAQLATDSTPFVSLVDPDDARFFPPGDLPSRVQSFCAETDQPVPHEIGALTRCIFESLALKYRLVLHRVMNLTKQAVDVIHIIGGGSQNGLLCQMTADATGIPVLAGPREATALGNAVVQLIALGELENMAQGRQLIRESFPLASYAPQNTAAWEAQIARFERLLTT